MRKICYVIITLFFLLSCSHKDNNAGSESTIRKEVMDVAVKYAMGKFKEPKETIDNSGIVTIVDNQVNFVTSKAYQTKYIIDPVRIFVGLIDDDAMEDAIITIYSINGQYLETTEHLIIMQKDGKFMLNRVIESNMKILEIKNRVITAEVSTRSLNSPLRNCSACKQVVKYQFKAGDLIRIE